MKIFATGRVHPERADVRFGEITWSASDGSTVSITCDSSQLFIRADFQNCDGYVAAYIQAQHVAETVVGALGFALGTGYSVELIQLIEESGASHVFGVRPGNLSFPEGDPIFGSALELSRKDLFFRFALRDYARAIGTIVDCAFYCYRAIEAIKSAFDLRGEPGGWAAMHSSLGTTREQIENVVKAFADPVRHGNWFSMQPTTSAERNAMLVLTREILARYVQAMLSPAGAAAV
jgi:hypothetical protein